MSTALLTCEECGGLNDAVHTIEVKDLACPAVNDLRIAVCHLNCIQSCCTPQFFTTLADFVRNIIVLLNMQQQDKVSIHLPEQPHGRLGGCKGQTPHLALPCHIVHEHRHRHHRHH